MPKKAVSSRIGWDFRACVSEFQQWKSLRHIKIICIKIQPTIGVTIQMKLFAFMYN